MPGITDLKRILKSLSPKVSSQDYVFSTTKESIRDFLHLEPLGYFQEEEATTMIISKKKALEEGIPFEECFRAITLQVHSSLTAVGLTAAISTKLAEKGISANVVAAYYHDHVFVPSNRAQDAIKALEELVTS